MQCLRRAHLVRELLLELRNAHGHDRHHVPVAAVDVLQQVRELPLALLAVDPRERPQVLE